jgi:hypothetical protein
MHNFYAAPKLSETIRRLQAFAKGQDAGFPAMERLITLFIFGEVNSRAQRPVKKFLPDVVELYSPRCHFLWC